MTRHAPTSAPGEMIGEYRVERVLGEGGMGAVYAAIHAVIDKRVALKVLRRELCTKAVFVNRFVQEARVVNRIGHPNIVDVFGFGTTVDGRAFLAMELLEGETLAARMAKGRIPIPEICDIAIEIAFALEAAHQAGIVHRDLKPENVFLARTRRAGSRTDSPVGDAGGPRSSVVKLLDFGIAKLRGVGTGGTVPGQVLGTPTYIAPEQARGEELDGGADIYALGVMLFEMLVGRPPFQSDSALELVAFHITEPPPTASSLRPELPGIADRLLATMLAKTSRERPSLATVREHLETLREETGAGRSHIMPVFRQRAASTEEEAGSTRDSIAAVRGRRMSPVVVVLLGIVMLAIGFGGIVLLWPYIVH